MSNETLFYIFGIATASFAVIVSFFGLRVKSFPGKAMPAVALAFAALVGASATFGVLNAQDEEEARAAEHAAEVAEAHGTESSEGAEAPEGAAGEQGGQTAPAPVKGPGGTLKLSADPTALLFDQTELSSKPGKVTIDFTNPAAIEHDVAILQDDQEIAKTPLIAQGETSVTAELAPGTYTYICTVPGHAEAGMEGTLRVK